MHDPRFVDGYIAVPISVGSAAFLGLLCGCSGPSVGGFSCQCPMHYLSGHGTGIGCWGVSAAFCLGC